MLVKISIPEHKHEFDDGRGNSFKAVEPFIYDLPENLAIAWATLSDCWSFVDDIEEQAEPIENGVEIEVSELKVEQYREFFKDKKELLAEGNRNHKQTYLESLKNLNDEQLNELKELAK